MTKYDNDVLSRDGWCGPTPPSPIQMVFKMVSNAWSIWSRGPAHNGWYNCYFADSLRKFNICSCQGIVLSRPHNIQEDIFLFLTFHVTPLTSDGVGRFISTLRVCHPAKLPQLNQCVCDRKYFLKYEIFLVVTLQYFLRLIQLPRHH